MQIQQRNLKDNRKALNLANFREKNMQFGGTSGNELVKTHLPKSWTNQVVKWVKVISIHSGDLRITEMMNGVEFQSAWTADRFVNGTANFRLQQLCPQRESERLFELE